MEKKEQILIFFHFKIFTFSRSVKHAGKKCGLTMCLLWNPVLIIGMADVDILVKNVISMISDCSFLIFYIQSKSFDCSPILQMNWFWQFKLQNVHIICVYSKFLCLKVYDLVSRESALVVVQLCDKSFWDNMWLEQQPWWNPLPCDSHDMLVLYYMIKSLFFLLNHMLQLSRLTER